MDEKELERFIEQLSDERPGKRYYAAQCLVKIGPPALEQLVSTIQHPDPDVRQSVVWCLGKIGLEAAIALPHLISALEDSDKYVRIKAGEALKQIGTKEALEALNEFVKKRDDL